MDGSYTSAVQLDFYPIQGFKTLLKINADYAAYLGMTPEKQNEYLVLQSKVDALEDKLADVRKDLAKLDHPSLKERLKSLRHGGLNGERQHLLAKETAIVKQLNAHINELRLMTNPFTASLERAANLSESQNRPVVTHVKAALVGQVPAHPAPPPPGTFDHAPPPDLAPKIPDQDHLAEGPEQLKIPKTKLNLAKGKGEDASVQPDELAEQKKPSVAEMLHQASSSPVHHDHAGHKTVADGIRTSAPSATPKPDTAAHTLHH